MADAIQLETNAADLLRRFPRLLPAMAQGVKTALSRSLLLVEDRVRGGGQLKWRRGSGGLAGRLTSYVMVAGAGGSFAGLDAAIGFRKTRGFPYELAQEFGAKARPGGAMAIPISGEARKLSAKGISARNFPRPLAMIGGKGGKAPLLVQTRTGRKLVGGVQLVPHYVLVKSIRPRLGFRKTVLASIPMISSEIEAGAKEGARAV